jgi:4-amino-4-deoxychorismate lyase
MVKFYSSTNTYDYSFSAVSLAYFLRYPNPYSRHVASTDTISRHFDPETQRLTTVRLHLKRSRLPPAVVKLLPKSAIGTTAPDGSTQSFILEHSVVDVKEGWMETESRNLDWNNVLSVIERQSYRRPARANVTSVEIEDYRATGIVAQTPDERTDVTTSVTLKSRIGEHIRKRRQRWGEQASATNVTGGGSEVEEAPAKQGWFSSWSTGAVQRAIESISLQRTERSQPKAQKGMSVVLGRLRHGGLQEVLEGMRHDREVEV